MQFLLHLFLLPQGESGKAAQRIKGRLPLPTAASDGPNSSGPSKMLRSHAPSPPPPPLGAQLESLVVEHSRVKMLSVQPDMTTLSSLRLSSVPMLDPDIRQVVTQAGRGAPSSLSHGNMLGLKSPLEYFARACTSPILFLGLSTYS